MPVVTVNLSDDDYQLIRKEKNKSAALRKVLEERRTHKCPVPAAPVKSRWPDDHKCPVPEKQKFYVRSKGGVEVFRGNKGDEAVWEPVRKARGKGYAVIE